MLLPASYLAPKGVTTAWAATPAPLVLVRADSFDVKNRTGFELACTDSSGIDGRPAFDLSHDGGLGVGNGIAPKLVCTGGSGVDGRLASELSRDSGLSADRSFASIVVRTDGESRNGGRSGGVSTAGASSSELGDPASDFGFDIAGGRSGGAPSSPPPAPSSA